MNQPTNPTPLEALRQDLANSFWQFMTTPRDFSHTRTSCEMAADYMMKRFEAQSRSDAQSYAHAALVEFAEKLKEKAVMGRAGERPDPFIHTVIDQTLAELTHKETP